jgi:hypothetical protein
MTKTRTSSKPVRKMTPKARKSLSKAAESSGIVDQVQIENAADMVAEVTRTLRGLRAERGRVDLDTAEKMGAKAHLVLARCHEMLAVLDEIKSIRRRQSTTLVGGKRSKS